MNNDRPNRIVRHFGPRIGEAGGGGMASVLAGYAALDWHRYQMRFTTTATLHTRFFSAEHLPTAVTSLVRTARQSPRPVAHFHLSSGGSLVREGGLLRMGRRLGLPTVASMHASDLDRAVQDAPRQLRRVLGSAHVVHALGHESAALLTEVLGDRTDVVVVPNCVPVPAVATPAGDQPRRVLFAGEVGTRKGVDVLLAAWPLVRAAVPDADLLVLGPVHDVPVRPLPGVTWLGAVPRERVLAEIRSCRTAVLPTRGEVQPMFVLEAMAAGRPVVTTPIAEIPRTVGDAGELVPVGDARALAAATVRFLLDAERATAVGACGRDRVQRLFSPARVAHDLEQIYDGVVARAGRHG